MPNIKNNYNFILVSVIVGAILFFYFILPIIDFKNMLYWNNLKEKLENTPDIIKIDQNKCSRDCCTHNNWPLPKDLQPKENSKYISSNFSCNFGANSGCVCLEPSQFNYLANHGIASTNKCLT